MAERFMYVYLGVLVVTCVLAAQPLGEFELKQNDPNPFCPSAQSGDTEIRFTLPLQCRILLQVWSCDTMVVVRTLFDGVYKAGGHATHWDGRDGQGVILSDGGYPYALTATDDGTGELLFYSMLVATIDCESVSAQPATWGRIKAGWR